jgi:hypothetical protein
MPLTTLDNDAWDDLLSFIEERRVIPIVGPELLQVSTERGPRLLYDWLAEKLATRLNVDIAALHSLRLWRERIREELHAISTAAACGAADRGAG